MLDRYVSGNVNRISPEGPVPVMAVTSESDLPGGAANVAKNVTALGARCTLIGVIGFDAGGRALKTLLNSVEGISVEFVESAGRPTTTKTRFIGQNQQIFRVDHEDISPINQNEEDRLIEKILPLIPHHNIVVLSDYAKGVLSKRLVSTVINTSQEYMCPVIVDPKVADLSLFSGAAVITPNQKETHAVAGIWPISDIEAEHAAAQLLSQFDIESVLITRAERGMTFLPRNGDAIHIRAEAREVYDVVGAGDTVIATLAVAMAAGAEREQAARIANTAAGIVVGKRGTATVSARELDDAFARNKGLDAPLPGTNIEDRSELQALANKWRQDGLKVGFTNGCFDILHVGHIRMLQFARQRCDRLIVGVNNDQSVRRLKGPTRPINCETDRAELLGALSFVDALILFEEDTPLELIRLTEPDVLIKGADYTIDKIIGADFVLERGGEVLTFEIVPGKSTTSTINRSQVRKS